MRKLKPFNSPRPGRRYLTLATLLFAASAIALTVFASAASASPTVLCEWDQAECPGSHTLPAGTTIEATASDFKFENSGPSFQCETATAKLTTKAASGEPLGAELTSFDLKGCSYNKNSCTVKTTVSTKNTPTITNIGSGDGWIVDFGVSWEWSCYISATGLYKYATFDGTGLETEFHGGEHATFAFEQAPVTCSGNLCPEEEALTANFTVQKPSRVYISTPSEGTAISTCDVTVSGSCSPKSRYPAGTTITANLTEPLTIYTSLLSVHCKTSTLKATTSASVGNPLAMSVDAWTFQGCGSNSAMDNCSLITEKAAKGASLEWLSDADGLFDIGTEGRQQTRVKCTVKGFVKLDCRLEFEPFEDEPLGVLLGGEPAAILIAGRLAEEPETGICPEDGQSMFEASYAVQSPTPLYVTP